MEYLRSSSWCRNWPVRGKKRCRLHGGFATGPRTPEGKARTISAMVEGRRRLLSQKFRRQRRQARGVVKREVERLLAEHEEQRRRLRFPPLSPEQREAVIDGFRQRVVVPSDDDGSMSWSDIQVLQNRLREAEGALERARADFRPAQKKLGLQP